jgi:hypothetical protein
VAQGEGPEFKPWYRKRKNDTRSWVWRRILTIPALRRLRQEDFKFLDNLGCIVKPCLKQNERENKNKTKNKNNDTQKTI